MKKFTGTKIFAWIFILIVVLILGYKTLYYTGTLKNFYISEKIVVKLYNKKVNYLIDFMNNTVINDNRYIVLNINNPYQGIISPRNNQMYSYDKKFMSNGGNLSLASGKVIFPSINNDYL